MKGLKQLVAEPEAAPAAPKSRRAEAALTRNGEPKRDRPDRVGQRLIAGHVDGATFKNFKILCAEEGATTQAMVSEAMELLFKKYHKPITPELTQLARERS